MLKAEEDLQHSSAAKGGVRPFAKNACARSIYNSTPASWAVNNELYTFKLCYSFKLPIAL